MRRLMLLVGAMAVVIASAVVVSGANSAGSTQARWVITDLGTLGGKWKWSRAVAINERGQVVGESRTASGAIHAFLWQDGKMTDLGSFGGTLSSPAGINDHGQIVGRSGSAKWGGQGHAFLWQAGRMTDLGTLGGKSSRAVAINERGQVTGVSGTTGRDRDTHAFLWERGRMTDLGTLGPLWSQAVAINNSGQVVGYSPGGKLPGGPGGIHVFLWQKGKMTDLGSGIPTAINERGLIIADDSLWENGQKTDLGTLPGQEGSEAAAINEQGQIVGCTYIFTPYRALGHAFLWEKGKMRDLGTLGAKASEAVAINENGQIVGTTYTAAPQGPNTCEATYATTFTMTGTRPMTRAYVWENDKMTDLVTLGGKQSEAVAINDQGQIVGWATTKNGQQHAVLWTLRRGT